MPNPPSTPTAPPPAQTAMPQPAPAPPQAEPPKKPAAQPAHRWKLWIALGAVLVIALVLGVPWIIHSLNTVSTDDAYVNGHVTLVAPRVSGQVARVLVDDNNRVRKGDLLVQLDPEPYQVLVNIATAAKNAAQSDLQAAFAQARSLTAQARSYRFALDHAIEDVHNKVALIASKVATMNSQQAILTNAKNEYERVADLFKKNVAPKQELDDRIEALHVAEAKVQQDLQEIYQVRVSLGLPPKPAEGDDLTRVPDDLDQTQSTVRQAQMNLIQAVAQLGVTSSLNQTPREMIAEFYRRDPGGNVDRILSKLVLEAPTVKQAEAKLAEAQRNLDQAQLNLRYCNVISEIDGVVTRREVNPGNNVIAGQSLMAVRSLTEIWIDANFKETQLARLRIGQSVDIDVDMYGNRKHFEGRISGFTMGTGSTLALLPAENATGNFVKVVQRLPVRIELVNYDPDQSPLFIGLSVAPSVLLNSTPTGANAGRFLQQDLNPTPASRMASTQPEPRR